jgi:energy-coupling factor transporter ATP-binding protein EcfA2
MPSITAKLSEPELLDRMRGVAEAFRPAAPIDRRSLFSGRTEQISDVFSVVAQPGQHAVIYGERGVGKTSLATVAAELLRSASMLTARATCDVSDDFGTVWRKALGEIEFRSSRQAVGFSERTTERKESAADALAGDVTPDGVRTVLQKVGTQREVAIFLDEFDRLHDSDERVLFADTIKALSDRGVRATIFLIGVADSVGDLIRDHRSIERALVQIHMPRMSREELADIVNGGMEKARMTITREAARKITALSQGLPHYTQLLSQLSAESALGQRRTEVAARDVDAAVERAIERAQQSLVEAYRVATATSGERDTLYPQVLLASALAEEDEYGFFGASEVSAPLEKILGRPCKPVTFARHLDRLSTEVRGGVLQKQSGTGRVRYRFENPLLQPYVAMKGLSEGVVRLKDLR